MKNLIRHAIVYISNAFNERKSKKF